MALEYEAWKEMNVDTNQDVPQVDYQLATLNTRAFGYESIRDTQENKEFWVNIAALVVIVGAALVFPPAGIALGAVYGAAELSSAVSGKDWVSGRELGTGERWFRGALAPLDIIPGAAAVKNFSQVSKINHFTEKLDILGKTTALTNKARSNLQKTNELMRTASKEAAARLKNADAVMKDRIAKVPTKLADGALASARVIDETIKNTKNFVSDFMPNLGVVTVGDVSKIPATNTHIVENIVQSTIKNLDGLNIRRIGNGTPLKLEDFTKQILETKPMNSRIPEKWYNKGGKISIDCDGTWTYINKSGISVKYPGGYPDFTPYMHPNVKPVTIEVHSPKNNPNDFKNANLEAGLSEDTDPPIFNIRRPPIGYTWHHHEDGETMLLVIKDIHDEFTHVGGQSKINGKNSR